MKGRSGLTNLISLCDRVTCTEDEAKAVYVVYRVLHKTLDSISHSILLEKLAVHGLDRCAHHWVKSSLSPNTGGEQSYMQLAASLQ